jgi:hypothetical protein
MNLFSKDLLKQIFKSLYSSKVISRENFENWKETDVNHDKIKVNQLLNGFIS